MLTTARSPRRSSQPWSVASFERRGRWRLGWLCGGLGAVALVDALVLMRLPSLPTISIGAPIVVAGLLVWLWQRPERGVYLLVACAVVLETTYSVQPYADDIGNYIPFFSDVATWTHVKGLAFSIAEVFMLLVLLIWLLKGIAMRTLRFNPGSMMWPLGLYTLMVVVGELHGLSSGGDFTLSLWEVRSQAYLFIVYVLVCNLITTRRQISTVIWIVVLGTGVKGVQGVFRLFVELHGKASSVESIFPHEQSFFFNVVLTIAPILFLYGGSRRLKMTVLALLPFIAVSDVANQRRAAILALAVGYVVVLAITAVVHPARRRLIVIIVLAMAVLLPPYYLIYSHRSGLTAEPARAIASAFTPDTRDALSDLYRVNEDADILSTMRTSPVIGYGYGKLMLTPYPLADISGIYIFWNLLPHDSILWVWMRLGTVGYLLLWFMIATAIVQAVEVARGVRDPWLKGLAVLIVPIIMQEVVVGYLDLQWSNYRNLIFMGVVFALIGGLANTALPARRTVSEQAQPAQRGGRLRARARPLPVGRRRGVNRPSPLMAGTSRARRLS